jgi:hypothetical protein
VRASTIDGLDLFEVTAHILQNSGDHIGLGERGRLGLVESEASVTSTDNFSGQEY